MFKNVHFSIKGTRPLMFAAEQPYEATDGKVVPRQKTVPALEQATAKLHTAKLSGGAPKIVVPAIQIQKAIQAIYWTMPGKRRGWKKILNSGIRIEPMHLPLTPQTWTVDARRAGNGGGKIGQTPILYRPRFDEWACGGILQFEDTMLDENEARMATDNAGQFNGLGSWRVGVGGPYGAFIVTEWKSD